MAHPYKSHAGHTGRSKMHSMHKSGQLPNKVLPMMKAVGENMSGGIRESSSSQQLKRQAGATGMKRGGRFGKHRSKTKPDVSALMAAPPPDMTSPPPATPAPGAPPPAAPVPPMQKRGGRTHSDVAEDKALIRKMVKPKAIKRAHGGRLPMAGSVKKGGAESGIGRLEKAHKR